MSGISYGPPDLSLSKGVSKNFSFEDFKKFQEIPAYCDDSSTVAVINFGTL